MSAWDVPGRSLHEVYPAEVAVDIYQRAMVRPVSMDEITRLASKYILALEKIKHLEEEILALQEKT